jgi:GNAT superfamily N-acetyltransferase
METGLALIPRIDQNLFEFYEYAALAAGKPCVHCHGYSFIALSPSPWANTVFRLALDDKGSIDRLVEGLRRGILPGKIACGPTSRPSDIERLLLSSGFQSRGEARGMTLDLSRRTRVPAPPGFSVAALDSRARFEAFAAIVTVNLFNSPAEQSPAFAELLEAMASARAFGVLGSFGGRPVSAAFAFIDGEGEGGLYFVATEAAFRGRGFGAATVSAALDELESRFASSCILQATALGKPVYESLGFEDACSLGRFILPEGSS